MKKYLVAAVAAVLVAAGAAFFLIQDKAGGDVEKGIAAFFANLPADYSKRGYGKVSVDIATKTVTIENIDVERSVGPRKLKIAKLEMVDPDIATLAKVFDPGKYAAGESDSAMNRLADRITMSGVLIDEPNNVTNIAQIVLLNVRARQFPAPPTAEWRAGLKEEQFSAILLRSFKLDSAELSDVTGSAGASKADMTMKKLLVTALNPDNLGSVRITGLTVVDAAKKDTVVLGQLDIADLQWAKLLEALASGAKPADFGQALALYQLGRVELTQLKIVNESDKTTIGMDKLAIGKLDLQGLGSASFSGLTVANAKDKIDIAIGEFDMRGLQFGGLLEAMGKDSKDVVALMTNKRMWVDSVAVRKIGGPTLAALGIALEEIALTAKRESEDAESSKFVINGLEIDATKSKAPQVKRAFESVKYQRAVFDVAIVGKADRRAKTLELTQFTLGAPQVGRFDLIFGLENYDYQGDIAKEIEAMMAAKLRGLKFSYKDDGLFEKLLALGASEQGMTVVQLREMLEAQIKAATEPFAQSPSIVAAGAALSAFLKKAGKLTLAANPKASVPISALADGAGDPPAMVDLLNLTLMYE